jgi:ribosomal protein L16 Arg81 hydroxylase
MNLDQRTLDAIIDRIFSVDDFFSEHWGRRPVHHPGDARECVGLYRTVDFLADLVATQPAPYPVSGVQNGKRVYSRHASSGELLAAVEAGSVASIKLSRSWHASQVPASWDWMRELFGRLCRAALMIYLSPTRSEDVDLFLAGPRSHLGVHYDLTHVFTLQLEGERRWVVEGEASLDDRSTAARALSFRQGKEADFLGPTKEFVLQPGDVLYVPASCVHSVTGVSWSVSLSLGLRAFNELDFVGQLLQAYERANYSALLPVDCLPESAGETHIAAKLELLRRVRALLRQLELAATGSLLAPLRLPEALGVTNAEGLDPYAVAPIRPRQKGLA